VEKETEQKQLTPVHLENDHGNGGGGFPTRILAGPPLEFKTIIVLRLEAAVDLIAALKAAGCFCRCRWCYGRGRVMFRGSSKSAVAQNTRLFMLRESACLGLGLSISF